jgi:hypothetical protein
MPKGIPNPTPANCLVLSLLQFGGVPRTHEDPVSQPEEARLRVKWQV